MSGHQLIRRVVELTFVVVIASVVLLAWQRSSG
jgi:hypothetical protein